jgi:alpha-mannosidase
MRRYALLVAILVSFIPLAQAQAPAQPKDYTAHVVGYAHMDMAWLWRWEESIHDIMYNTFRNQLQLMDRYPDFTYAQDQAVVFEMTEHYYPDIFKEIVQKARAGNFIPVSSSWVQMDENVIDGESLVRQFLYGQKYSKEKFGHYVRVAWQPDVFGHPYSMPQIARKAGIEFYLFNRPHDPSRPPIIWWQGLDGTRVLGYTTPGEYTQPMDHEHTTVLGTRNADRAGVKNIMVLYGMGDHGGGPNPDDVAGIEKLNQSPNDVRVKTTRVEDYFDLLLVEKKDHPVVAKELNPVFSGCYTTQVDMKRHNRESEQLLLDAEKLSELAVFFGYRDYYPNRDITQAWELALLNQAHDLAAGSGIGPIYADAARQYEEVFDRGHRALNFSLQNLGLQLNTLGDGLPVVVYNPQSWHRTDLVTAEVSAFSLPLHMVAVHGDEVVPVQVLKPATKAGVRETATVAFVGHNVPQMGLKLYRILPESSTRKAPASSVQAGTKPRPYAENEFYRVEIDPQTGYIARVYDKQNKREAFRGEGSYLTALQDTAEQAKKTSVEYAGPAWDIGLTGKKWDINKAARVEVIEQGPVRAVVRVVHRFRDSEFTQDVTLIAGVPRVDVNISTEWYERATFLKAVFPVSVSSNKVSAEIPYGAIERDQTGDEMVMGKWVDISDANYGVAILNNGRNGYDAKDDVIRLSVIRGSWGPDPRADEGPHTFSYSIFPHRGGWREGKVVFQALAFNSPLIALQEPAHASPQEQWAGKAGGLPETYSFIKTDSDHVVLYAMKQMEGFYNTDAILRFYETEGREGDVTVEFPRSLRVTETNLLEDTVVGPIGEGDTVRFHIKPWEIKTLRLAKTMTP